MTTHERPSRYPVTGVTGFLSIARLAAQRGLPVSCHVFHHLHAQLAAVTGASVEYMLPQTGVDAMHLLVPEDSPGTTAGWFRHPHLASA